MKIKHSNLPASEPVFSDGLQVFTTPYSGASTSGTPGSAIGKKQIEEGSADLPMLRLETQPLLVVDWPTAIANFDKLMDAYEAGGTEAVKERFREQLKERNREAT